MGIIKFLRILTPLLVTIKFIVAICPSTPSCRAFVTKLSKGEGNNAMSEVFDRNASYLLCWEIY